MKEDALARLLETCFSTSELRRFLRFSYGRNLAEQLPDEGQTGLREAVSEAVDQLRRRGLCDEVLFERLAELRPQHEAVIRRVERDWNPDYTTWCRRPPLLPPTSLATGNRGLLDSLRHGPLRQAAIQNHWKRPKPLSRMAKVFISYAKADHIFAEELVAHLSVLAAKGYISELDEIRIAAGEDWEKAYRKSLAAADIIVLLVSPSFLVSEWCWHELRDAVDRAVRGEIRLVAVVVRHCDWYTSPVEGHLLFPNHQSPVAEAEDPDHVWFQVSEQIRKLIVADAREPADE